MRDRATVNGPTATTLSPVQHVQSRMSHHRSRSQEHIATFTSYVGPIADVDCSNGGPGGDGRSSSSLGLSKVHSSNAIDVTRSSLHAPISQLAIASAAAGSAVVPSAVHNNEPVPFRAKHSVPAVRRAADMRINKTKTTVTELQRAKHDLETQLSNLTRFADDKQAENASLKFEMRKLKEELHNLRNEHQTHQRLSLQSVDASASSFTTAVNDLNSSASSSGRLDRIMVDACTSPMASRSQSLTSTDDILDGNAVTTVLDNWDRQSSCSEISLACLQDRIVQMEETHYSTTEELQATLAELTELQDIVDEMNNEIQATTEQNKLLADTLHQRNVKVDNQSLQIENLKYLLLGSVNSIIKKTSDEGDEAEHQDNEKRLLLLLKAAHDEQEEIKYRYFEAQQAVHQLRHERQQMADMCALMKERMNDTHMTMSQQSDVSASERSRRLNQLEAAVLESRLKQTAVQRDNQSLQGTIKSQAEHVCTLENQLADLQHECEVLKEQRRQADMDEHNQVDDGNNRQLVIEQLQADKKMLQVQIDDLQSKIQLEREEWAEFQADLQTAVVVANNFKMEAQEDIDRLTEERENLEKEKSLLTDELTLARDRLAQMSSAASAPTRNLLSPHHTSTVRDRIDSYLKQATPSPIRQASVRVSMCPSTTATMVASPATRPTSASSVRALIESLESTTDPVDKLNYSATTTGSAGSRLASVPCSRQSTGDVGMPSAGTPTLPPNCLTSHNAKLAASEGDLHTPALVPQTESQSTKPSRQLFDKLPTSVSKVLTEGTEVSASCSTSAVPSAPVVTSSTIANANANNDTAQIGQQPKGILVNRNNSPALTQSTIAGARKFLDADGVDPLAKLMKDAPRGLSRRNALLKWCQNRLCSYKNIDITNFSSSWNDGLAFCALLHSYVPDQVDFDKLQPTNTRANFQLAFSTASAHGVPDLLNVDEMVTLERPDWQQVMEYIKEVYKRFEKQ